MHKAVSMRVVLKCHATHTRDSIFGSTLVMQPNDLCLCIIAASHVLCIPTLRPAMLVDQDTGSICPDWHVPAKRAVHKLAVTACMPADSQGLAVCCVLCKSFDQSMLLWMQALSCLPLVHVMCAIYPTAALMQMQGLQVVPVCRCAVQRLLFTADVKAAASKLPDKLAGVPSGVIMVANSKSQCLCGL